MWHARMQALERRRLKRMRGDDSDGSDDEVEAPAGGFAKRRFQAQRAEADPEGKSTRCSPLRAPLGCPCAFAALMPLFKVTAG